MSEINISARDEEIRIVALGDQGEVRRLLEGFVPGDEVSRIARAVSADHGVSLEQFIGLLTNAGVMKATRHAASAISSLSCNVDPKCWKELAHAGECDPEVPF